jgi:FkbM family methyltransferase
MNLNYTLLLPSRWGWQVCLSNDPFQAGSILTQGEWAPDETFLVCDLIKPGWTVLDIGANIGTTALPFARSVGQEGRVLAFEPQLHPFNCLVSTITLNSLSHFVMPLRVAVGDTPGEILVPLLDPTTRGCNFGGCSLLEKHTTQTEVVPLITIDSLNLPDCHFIKADIEGMEAAALRGAAKTVDKFRPLIWAEQLDRFEANKQGLKDFFKANDYKAWKMATKLYSPHNSRRERHNMFVLDDGSPMEDHNVLAVPSEDQPPGWVSGAEVFA